MKGMEKILALMTVAILTAVLFTSFIDDTDAETTNDFVGNEIFNTALAADEPLISISLGWQHTIALKSDGTVLAWGQNGGQLGDGTTTNRSNPVQVMISETIPLSGVVAISAGDYFAVALDKDGHVWAWGDNPYGQLGDGTTEDRDRPTLVKDAEGTAFSNVTEISAGGNHTVALDENGNVWAWGSNEYGQLGDGTTENRDRPTLLKDADGETFSGVSAISAGGNHTVALDENGHVWAWGDNGIGQLGDGTTEDRDRPTLVKDADGETFSGVSAISAGDAFTVALVEGKVYTWGRNEEGQLGDGTIENRDRPTLVKNADGTALSNVTEISAGGYHTVALVGAEVYTWGLNGDGQLGDGTTEKKSRPTLVKNADGETFSGVSAISAGGYHTVAVDKNGYVWAWGWNDYGQLGDGTTTKRSNPVHTVHDTFEKLNLIVPIPVTYVEISSNGGFVIDNKGTIQMIATVLPNNATNKTVTWSISSGNEYASIDENGLLTAISIGSVTVKATANDGSDIFGEKVVTVIAAEGEPKDDTILYVVVALCIFAAVTVGAFFFMRRK